MELFRRWVLGPFESAGGLLWALRAASRPSSNSNGPSTRRSRLAILAVAAALATAGRGAALPRPGEWSLSLSGVAPASRDATVAPGLDLGLRPGPGAGVAATFFEPHDLATLVALDVSRFPLRLTGPGGSTSGGGLDFVPFSLLEERRFASRGRMRSYLGAGIVFPFVFGTDLSPALRRPDHPALLVGAGAGFALSERTALVLDLRWVPYAETLVVVPKGEIFKSQERMLDMNPLTVSVGMAWRPF